MKLCNSVYALAIALAPCAFALEPAAKPPEKRMPDRSERADIENLVGELDKIRTQDIAQEVKRGALVHTNLRQGAYDAIVSKIDELRHAPQPERRQLFENVAQRIQARRNPVVEAEAQPAPAGSNWRLTLARPTHEESGAPIDDYKAIITEALNDYDERLRTTNQRAQSLHMQRIIGYVVGVIGAIATVASTIGTIIANSKCK